VDCENPHGVSVAHNAHQVINFVGKDQLQCDLGIGAASKKRTPSQAARVSCASYAIGLT